MIVYANAAELVALTGSHRKWQRTAQALEAVAARPAEVAYSIGDSLTYWRSTPGVLSVDDLVGHRRYLGVLCPLEGDLALEVAKKDELVVSDPYSDLSDREFFCGQGRAVTLAAGQVGVLEAGEAWRVAGGSSESVVVLHVTVEN